MAGDTTGLVRPSGASASSNAATARRAVVSAFALLALAALVAVITTQDRGTPVEQLRVATPSGSQLAFGDGLFRSSVPKAAREGSVRAGVLPHAVHVPKEIAERGLKVAQTVQLAATKSAGAALKFGEAAFNADAPAASKEGAVRGSKKPDFVAPLGGLGEEGLAAQPAGHGATLAFGDASFAKDASAASKEGSVRGAVKPDFAPPLGDLGKTGLVAAPARAAGAAARLAFGDAAFTADAPVGSKEGSVRGAVKPDFAPPLGDLGKTGLAAAKAKAATPVAAKDKPAAPVAAEATAAAANKAKNPKLGAAEARAAADAFYDAQAKALKVRPLPRLSDEAAAAEMASYFDAQERAAAAAHVAQLSSAHSRAASARKVVGDYYDGLQATDKRMHAAALDREHAEAAALEARAKAPAPVVKASTRQELAEKPAKKVDARARVAVQDAPTTHGFHAGLMTDNPKTLKQLKQARAIVAKDLADAFE